MDIYEYLKKDHEKVSDLFKQFENTDDIVFQKEIMESLLLELTLHSVSEQETFYKELAKHEESEEVVEHGMKEHLEIQNLLEQISKLKKVNTNWKNKILKLKDVVEHHVKDEEGEMFRKAKKVFSEEEAKNLKEKMHYYKVHMRNEIENF